MVNDSSESTIQSSEIFAKEYEKTIINNHNDNSNGNEYVNDTV